MLSVQPQKHLAGLKKEKSQNEITNINDFGVGKRKTRKGNNRKINHVNIHKQTSK